MKKSKADLAAYMREYRRRNLEKMRDYDRAWYARNQVRIKLQRARRAVRKAQSCIESHGNQ